LPDETIKLVTPPTVRRRPAIVFVHGGGWQRATLLPDELDLARTWAQQTGWVVACVNYPTALHPYFLTEPRAVAAAVAFVRRLPQVDPRRVALWGESAGSQLAMAVGYRAGSRVRAVVGISGPTDMRLEYGSAVQQLVVRFEESGPATAYSRYVGTSPVAHVSPAVPPTFQAIGLADPFVPADQVNELDHELAVNGVRHETIEIATNDHATLLDKDRTAQGGPTVAAAALGFIQSIFSKPPLRPPLIARGL
jgi:acetyl esterase/lipase